MPPLSVATIPSPSDMENHQGHRSPYGYNTHSPAYQPSPQGQAFNPLSTSSPGQFDNQTSLSVAPRNPNPNAPTTNILATTAGKLTTRSCDVCRKRKVKCDKFANGCTNCKKANIQCHYPGPGRAPRRPKGGGTVSARETELLKRLRKLESVVQELSGGQGVDVDRFGTGRSSVRSPTRDVLENVPSTHVSPENRSGSDAGSSVHKVEAGDMEEGNPVTRKWLQRLVNIGDGPPQGDIMHREMGKLVIDPQKSNYGHDNLEIFESLKDGVAGIREILEGKEEEENIPAEETEGGSEGDGEPDYDELPEIFNFKSPPSNGHQSFLFGYSSSTVDLRSLHPLPSQIPFFWSTYVENVDPLTKIFHVPTMNIAIRELQTTKCENLNSSMEAALFSIYYSVISSMSQSEVEANFDSDKTTLLWRYRFGVEQALAKADLFTTTEIVTVQAYVLFLFCLKRHDVVKLVWSLTGIACRLAVGIGLHRDGSKLGLSPFETEMRRRLWWALRLLDTRASEDFGADSALHEGMSDTLLPLNINDSDIAPDSRELPKERIGVTDMTFCLMRYEIAKVSGYVIGSSVSSYPFGRMVPETTLLEKEQMVRNLNQTLETKYIQYCLDAGPLCWVGATISRLVVAKLSIIPFLGGSSCNPANFPKHVRDRLFIASIEIMEYSSLLESGTHTKKWGWVFYTYVQWHALIFILVEICRRDSSALLERAWRAVDSVFTGWDNAVKYSRSQKNGELWLPLKKLMAKARKKREDDIRTGVCVAVRPEYQKEKEKTPCNFHGDGSKAPKEQPYAPAGEPPYERHVQRQAQEQTQLEQPQPRADNIDAPHNIEVLRPLQQGIPRPDPRFMPELYAAAPFSPMTWEQPQANGQYGDVLQTQFQQFAQNQLFSQQPQFNTAEGNQLPQQGERQMPWLMEAPLGDLDMIMSSNGIEAGEQGEQGRVDDFAWEGIDDLVRGIQMRASGDTSAEFNGGGWW